MESLSHPGTAAASNDSRVLEWIHGSQLDTPPATARISTESSFAPENTRKRKLSDTKMEHLEDHLMLEAKAKLQANQSLHPAPQVPADFEREPLCPTDSASQMGESTAAPRSSSPSKNALSATGSVLRKKGMLKHSVPNFTFLSVSGRGGLSANDETDD
ncbi:hypothetical protein AA313_de0200800 [Arthrobotrys entomopaga]|nr:hypothetical protein AA313_de0200800 [Arthrobotrys entomopaga]